MLTEIASILKDFTPGAAGIWVLVVWALVNSLKEWRETRKLSLEDRIARRDGYAKQVESLSAENRDLRHDLADLERRYGEYRDLCHSETDQLREQVRSLQDELAGIKRTIAAGAQAEFDVIPSTILPKAMKARREAAAQVVEEESQK